MVRIRLSRTGLKHQPSYRIMVADRESPRDGRYIENIGSYIPTTEPVTLQVKEDRLAYWLGVGAQPSESIVKIFQVAGIWERVGYKPNLGYDPAATTEEKAPKAKKKAK